MSSLIFNTHFAQLRKIVAENPQLTHAQNICTKALKTLKTEQNSALKKILPLYYNYIKAQFSIKSFDKTTIKKRVALLNKYYEDYNSITPNLDEVFTSQSKFRPTILEEFMFILFKDYIEHIKTKYNDKNDKIKGGAAKSYTNLYFSSASLNNFIQSPNVEINVKDQDFAIFRTIDVQIENEKKELKVPILAIENKTYLDKTMLDGVIATAEKIKAGNPYTWFVVVSENYEVDLSIDPIYSKIDQIYVLRKSRRKDKFSLIDEKVVLKVFSDAQNHIERPWADVETKMRKDGVIF